MNSLRLLLISPLLLLAEYQEPSAFGAGNLDSPNPYGLTQNEKHIYSNKKLLEEITDKLKVQDDNLRKEFYKLKSTMTEVTADLDGLKSVVDGESTKRVKTEKEYQKYIKMLEFIQKDMNELKEQLATSQKSTKETLDNFTTALGEISSIIDTINNSYVSKAELEAFKAEILAQLSVHKDNSKKQEALSGSNPAIMKDAKRLYKKQKYDEAKYRFEHLVNKNYKPAESNYYLGEIAYYLKDYKNAPVYFKKSYNLYKKASYMPTLFLHIAISYEKQGSKKSARKFYNALIKSYPKSKSATIATSNLKKMK
jgi:TolA-binding protein